MSPYSLPPLLAAGLTLMLGVFVLLRSPKEKLNLLFFRFTFAIFIWLSVFALGYSIASPKWALFTFRAAYIGVVFIPVLCLHFHLEFLSIYRPKTMKILYLLSAFFLCMTPTPYFFKAVKHFYWGFYPQAGALYVLFIVFFTAVVGTSSFLLVYQLIRGSVHGDAQDFKYQQLKYLALGFIIAYTGSVDYIAKFGIEFYPFGYVNIIVFVMILTYAMLRHRLLDIETMMYLFRQHKLATLGLLAAGLNHEIRNPLYIIKGNAETYLDNWQQGIFKDQVSAVDKSKEILSKTISQAERAIDIVQRFSSFVKLSRSGYVRETTSIYQCVQNVLEFLDHEITNRKIKIETFLSEDLSIIANPREVEEVVFNIVLNGCQAMGDEGTLSIQTLRQGQRCLIIIKDTGPGIPPHLHRKIFEPFYSSKTEKGTGLGLYICQFLVAQNGGKIQLNSKVGKGTVFVLDFPLKTEAAGAAESVDAAPFSPGPTFLPVLG